MSLNIDEIMAEIEYLISDVNKNVGLIIENINQWISENSSDKYKDFVKILSPIVELLVKGGEISKEGASIVKKTEQSIQNFYINIAFKMLQMNQLMVSLNGIIKKLDIKENCLLSEAVVNMKKTLSLEQKISDLVSKVGEEANQLK
jgi:hypothetical protein